MIENHVWEGISITFKNSFDKIRRERTIMTITLRNSRLLFTNI